MENDQKSKPVFFHGTKIVLTTTTQLIDELEALTDRHLSIVRDFQTMDHEILEEKPHPDAWNALECIHHLNLYGNYYLTEIEKALDKNRKSAPEKMYKSGWIGNYFAREMWPGEKSKKTKTFKKMDPAGQNLSVEVLKEFEEQQLRLQKLLKKSRNVDLMKIKIPLTISRWIQLRLGDILRIVIFHNERHIRQAIRALGSAPTSG